jgi:hypothetical protein
MHYHYQPFFECVSFCGMLTHSLRKAPTHLRFTLPSAMLGSSFSAKPYVLRVALQEATRRRVLSHASVMLLPQLPAKAESKSAQARVLRLQQLTNMLGHFAPR